MKKAFIKLTSTILASLLIFQILPFKNKENLISEAASNAQEKLELEDKINRQNSGPVFHVWNWKFQDIKNNLQNIKDSGFNSVQISPVQGTKTHYIDYTNWWALYQPINFKIGNPIVSANYENQEVCERELEELCTSAHEKGMDIIVDVVANHMANEAENFTVNGVIKIFEGLREEHFNNNREMFLKNGINEFVKLSERTLNDWTKLLLEKQKEHKKANKARNRTKWLGASAREILLKFLEEEHKGLLGEFKKCSSENEIKCIEIFLRSLKEDELGRKIDYIQQWTPSRQIDEDFRNNSLHWHNKDCFKDNFSNLVGNIPAEHLLNTLASNSADWDRNRATQGALGMPDLNTGNGEVQGVVIAFLNKLLEKGVDGFRFDAAKHIELPSDSLGSDFWTKILNHIKSQKTVRNKRALVYGEILSDSYDILNNYLKTGMGITFEKCGESARNIVYSGNSANFGENVISLKAKKDDRFLEFVDLDKSKIVSWVESHDNYANENCSTSYLTQEDINLAWSIVASRELIPLYLARPELSKDPREFKIPEEIVKINEFYKDMLGQPDYIIHRDPLIFIERGCCATRQEYNKNNTGNGAVIINYRKDKTAQISSVGGNNLTPGIYFDQVKKDRAFRVSEDRKFMDGTVNPREILILERKLVFEKRDSGIIKEKIARLLRSMGCFAGTLTDSYNDIINNMVEDIYNNCEEKEDKIYLPKINLKEIESDRIIILEKNFSEEIFIKNYSTQDKEVNNNLAGINTSLDSGKYFCENTNEILTVCLNNKILKGTLSPGQSRVFKSEVKINDINKAKEIVKMLVSANNVRDIPENLLNKFRSSNGTWDFDKDVLKKLKSDYNNDIIKDNFMKCVEQHILANRTEFTSNDLDAKKTVLFFEKPEKEYENCILRVDFTDRNGIKQVLPRECIRQISKNVYAIEFYTFGDEEIKKIKGIEIMLSEGTKIKAKNEIDELEIGTINSCIIEQAEEKGKGINHLPTEVLTIDSNTGNVIWKHTVIKVNKPKNWNSEIRLFAYIDGSGNPPISNGFYSGSPWKGGQEMNLQHTEDGDALYYILKGKFCDEKTRIVLNDSKGNQYPLQEKEGLPIMEAGEIVEIFIK